ncbi:MAG: biotin/lipoyl-binding protein, partial [Planctomycetes bacterium]|nr:biotin/lipoyl-binding protein [Planctomycetota bacterium]
RVYDWTGRPWEKGKPGTHTTRTDAGVAFVWPRSEGNTTTIEVSHTYTDAATRLVAFDRAGKLFVGTDSHLGSGRGITTRLYTFSGLALQDVNGFEFQQRPYDSWITFNNVSVKPGHRTAVQVEITRDGAGSSQAGSPAAAPSASESSLPFPKKSYEFKWERVPLPKVLAELQEQTGLSVVGADDIEKAENWTISFASIRPVGFDEALLLINHLIQDKGVGYWIVRRDQCLEIRDVVSWFRRVPPAQMFTTEEAYQSADLPKWEVASVVYQPRHASAKSLADRAMDEVPDNTARARPTPDGSRIELKGIVEYIDQQLEIIKKWDVPQDESAALLAFEKAAGSAGRRYSLYGSRSGTPEDNLITLYSSALSHAGEPPGVPVHARTDGVTVEVKVKNGQAVKKDDLLARFDDEEIKIDLAAAEIRLEESSKKLKHFQSRPLDVEERVQAESAARLAELDVQRCRLRLDRAQIKSPADGVVVGRGAPENDVALLVNQQVKAGELLMYIRPKEQRSSAGGPESTFGGALRPEAANGSAVATRPEDATSLTELLDRRSPWLPQAQAGLEKAIRELEAAKEELRSSRFMTENHPRLMQLKKRIEDLRNALSPSVAAKKVYAQADGVVAEVKVREGQAVKKDDLLVQLDAEEIKLERMAAQVKYDQAQTELERLAKLKEHSAVGQFEYQKVATDAKLAEIEVRRLDLRLSRTRITSPADGKVRATEGSVSDLVGQRVTAGDLLLYIEPSEAPASADYRRSGTGGVRGGLPSEAAAATRPASRDLGVLGVQRWDRGREATTRPRSESRR